MRRATQSVCLASAILVTAVALWLTSGMARPPAQPDDPNDRPASPTLPLRQVVLFSSGVGYFQREGEIDGDARIDLTFPAGDVNDLLKSLVVEDSGGGKIGVITYDGQEPVERALKSFALDLTYNPTLGQLLNQARGEKVEVVLQANAAQTGTLTGYVVGMEVQKVTVGKETCDGDVLNLSCVEGIRSVPLSQVQRMRFLNAALEEDFRRALAVLASSHNAQKRAVSLRLTGQGKRTVKIGYVVESPMWKSTYRLALDKGGKPSLQGWAVVENTTDEDWRDVRVALVAGRPLSFQMDLYQPLFVPRPTVEPELFASLRPPVYTGAIVGNQFGMQGGGNLGNLANNNFNFNNPGQFGQFGQLGQFGNQGGFVGNRFQWGPMNGMAQDPLADPNGNRAPPTRLTYEEMQKRRQEMQTAKDQAKQVGQVLAALEPADLAAVAEGAILDDSFQYLIDQKVSLPRHKSAMLPTIEKKLVEGKRVSIFNPAVHTKHPLRGLRFKNTTGSPLVQGPVSVSEANGYAGDARLPDLQPDEERYLAFAIDLATEVVAGQKESFGPNLVVRSSTDAVQIQHTLRQTRTYLIRNRSKQDRTLVIEHPLRKDWRLAEGKKPIERTRDHYRFEVDVAAGKTVSYEVAEEQERSGGEDKPAWATTDKGDRVRGHASPLGLETRQTNRPGAVELLGASVARGVLRMTTRQQEKITYQIRNTSQHDREVVLEHRVRPGWAFAGEAKPVEGSSDLYRLPIKLPTGKTLELEVAENREQSGPRPWADLDEELLAKVQAAPVVGAKVKDALKEVDRLRAALAVLAKEEAEAKDRLKAIGDDQTRLRANIDKVPRDSAAYKRYLDKFDAQETQIEKLQIRIEELQQSLVQQRKAFDAHVKGLTVD